MIRRGAACTPPYSPAHSRERARIPSHPAYPLGPGMVSAARGVSRTPRCDGGRFARTPAGGPRLPLVPAQRPDRPARGLFARAARARGGRQATGQVGTVADRTVVRTGRRTGAVGRGAAPQPALPPGGPSAVAPARA